MTAGDAGVADREVDDASVYDDAAMESDSALPLDGSVPTEIAIAFGNSVRRTTTFDGKTFPLDLHDVKDAGADSGAAAAYSVADHDKDYSAAVGMGVIVVVGDRGAFSSKDGSTWAAIPQITGNMHSARVLFTGGRLVVVSLAAAFTSTDGATWVKKDAPWTIGHLQTSLYAHGTILVLGESGNLHRSTDDGATFSAQTLPAQGGVVPTNFSIASAGATAKKGARLLVVARTPAGYRAVSDDDGATWRVTSGGNAKDGTALAFGPALIWNGAEFVVLPGSNAPATFVSADGETSWQTAAVGPRINAATAFGSGYLGVGGPASTKVYASADAKTWSASPVFPTGTDPASLYPSPNVLSYYGIARGFIGK